ncbi:JAB domain-containing protein [Mesoterricola sediminis]|uniref:DNA repair protein RadC n=1 Tax=Mesoterricola sediminis TaxID=2927980 RepID=A0AA48GU09_9BACT|nr:DNA repair protein RadC [Mesoterricola sediminis]BDU76184.1 DNA repair protein RadC [Mesoterricola sediminis]
MRIADLSPEQRPRERLLGGRGDELGDAEVLALLWGTGTRGLGAVDLAHALLARHGGLKGLLGLGPREWAACEGLGPAKAGQLWAAVELGRRLNRGPGPLRLGSPQAAGAYLLDRCAGWAEERFGLLALNVKGVLLADRILSQGTASATLVSPREFYREALRFGAVSAIGFHNHPSGEPQPSHEDRRLTRALREAGHALGVPLVDHIVVGARTFHSFRASEGWA